MRLFGITGWSGAGKTSLILRLLPALRRRGMAVATIKHSHHDIEIDGPDDDSRRLRDAGAAEVLVVGGHTWALVHPLERAVPGVDSVIARLGPVDLVLVEGFKGGPHVKLEVHRVALGRPLICRDDRTVAAVASDARLTGLPVPMLDLDDEEAIATFIVRVTASAEV